MSPTICGKPRKTPRIAPITDSARPAMAAPTSSFGIGRSAMSRSLPGPKKKPIRSGLERIGEIAKGAGTRLRKSDDRGRRYVFTELLLLRGLLLGRLLSGLLLRWHWRSPPSGHGSLLSRHTRERNVNSRRDRRAPSAVERRCASEAPWEPDPPGSSRGREPGS